MRSVLDVDGKSFDAVLSDTSLSWGHVGIEEHGLGEKSRNNVIIAKAHIGKIILFPNTNRCISHCKIAYPHFEVILTIIYIQLGLLKTTFSLFNKSYKISEALVLNPNRHS